MKNKKYLNFNLLCIFFSLVFLIGIFYFWLGKDGGKEIERIPVVTFSDILVERNSRLENIVDQKDDGVEQESGLSNEEYRDNENVESDEVENDAQDISNNLEKMNLAVPFTSQAPEKNWDQPWQDACEEAVVLMLDAYYNGYGLSVLSAKDEILKILNFEEEKEWGGSIEIEKVQELTEFYLNKKTKIVEDPTVEELKDFIREGKPVLVVADGKVLPNPNFRNGGPVYHALVIRGFTETEFITNDPGTQFGENFVYKYDDLMNSIHDWNDGDVKNGRVVVLVVE